MNLNEGQRVYARNFHVNGPGVVVYIAPTRDREMLPVQVELDEGDEDGHRMYRFKYDEVEAID